MLLDTHTHICNTPTHTGDISGVRLKSDYRLLIWIKTPLSDVMLVVVVVVVVGMVVVVVVVVVR